MPPPKPSVPAASPALRLVRLSGLALALALALLAIALLAPARAPARATIAHRGSCPAGARHVKHTGKHAGKTSRCIRRSSRHGKPVTPQPAKHSHPVRKGSTRSSNGTSPTLALCEDGSAPVSTSSTFACRDGSEPGCESGSEPGTGPGGAPVCVVAAEAPSETTGETTGEACSGEGECQTAEWTCEDSFNASEAPAGCERERSGGGEAVS